MADKPIQRKPQRLTVAAICRRLAGVFGPVSPPPKGPVLDELIATILSQNTSDANSGAAFDRLRDRFADWDAVRRAPVASIVQAIRQAGLANRKAPRIRAILRQIYRERGVLSLDFLCCLPTTEAYAYLRRFPGVGPKTAACVLLFACGQRILPVDTHVHRLSRRLGLIGPRTGAEQAHEELARQVPAPRVLDFHIQLIRHGRSVCLARSPRCRECVLVDRCPEGHRRLREVRT